MIGVGARQIKRYESDEITPLSHAKTLANILGTSPCWLLFGSSGDAQEHRFEPAANTIHHADPITAKDTLELWASHKSKEKLSMLNVRVPEDVMEWIKLESKSRKLSNQDLILLGIAILQDRGDDYLGR